MTDMPRELRPCPFCGGEGILKHNPSSVSKWQYVVECMQCYMNGAEYGSNQTDAIINWNTRHTDPNTLVITREQLEGMREKEELVVRKDLITQLLEMMDVQAISTSKD